jgi:tetratricopeptide (TPR) repeat protein
MSQFSTEGFDLDVNAIQAGEGDDVVYELGGGTTVFQTAPQPEENNEPEPLDGIGKAEEWKQKGNEEFKKGSYLEAYDLYTEAIMACPGELKGDQILKLKEEYDENQREKMYESHKLAEEERRKAEKNKEEPSKKEKKDVEKAEEFKLPQQEFGDKLAIYYCNRGATLLYMDRYDEAIQDSDVALLLNPNYIKAYVRRSTAYEKSEKTEDALLDAKKALELDPTNATTRKSVARLQKIEDDRLEKLKDETIGKAVELF